MSDESTVPNLGERDRIAPEIGELPPLSDPGKDERAASGVPVVPVFDGYRALAILGIVFFHVLINSGVVQRAGGSFGGQLIWATGPELVDILFIVSGFVVFLPTVAQRRALRQRLRVRDPPRRPALPRLLALPRRDAAGDGDQPGFRGRVPGTSPATSPGSRPSSR